jgi:hypothetical protein
MEYKCNVEMHKVCTNSAICHLCDGERLFKDPVAERKAKEEAKIQRQVEKRNAPHKVHSREKKEGMGFEKQVAKKWNSAFSQQRKPITDKPRFQVESDEAQRQPNSGATWRAKGDIKLYHALMECKQRGTLSSKGEKQIAIMKDWLDKLEIEAFQENREFWYLPFGFKGSDDIYLVKPYEHEIQMVLELRQARERIEELESRVGGENNGSNN